jgi:NADH-ubiquinone oxidoreductase chain 4
MVLASQRVKKYSYHSTLFNLMILSLTLLLYLTFTSSSMFLFYLYFEGSLIPTLILILG